MNLSTKQRLTDTENRLVVAKEGGGMQEGWIGSFGLADENYYIKMDKQQGPTVYSTGNYIQYPGIKRIMEKNMKKIYICITESRCYTVEINTTL